MAHLHEDVTLDLPIAKYRDSVIIWDRGLLIEVIITRVVSVLDNEGKLAWVYYDNDDDGSSSALLEGDILMNLTTGRNFIKERAPREEPVPLFDLPGSGDIPFVSLQ